MTVSLMAYCSFLALILILMTFAAAVVWRMVTGSIALVGLISEPGEAGGKASLSRFQFLIFTFVVAGLFLLLSIEAGTFVEIPTNVLALLGISGGSFLVSKAVTAQEMQKKEEIAADERKTVAEARMQTRVAELQQPAGQSTPSSTA